MAMDKIIGKKNCRRKLAKTMWKPLGKPLNVDKEIYAKRKILQYFIDEKQKKNVNYSISFSSLLNHTCIVVSLANLYSDKNKQQQHKYIYT